MKKILTLLVFAFACIYSFAQCTPKTNMTNYIEPEKLADALIDKPYSQVIYFKIPKDTMLEYQGNLVPFSIQKAELYSIEGIPAGFTYACNISNCTFNGGTSGCAVITGTASPVQIGGYGVKVRIKTYAKVLTIYNVNRFDSGVYDFFVRQYPLSDGQDLAKGEIMAAYPNPASSAINIQTAPLNKDAEIYLVNMSGVTVARQFIAAGNSNQSVTLPTDNLANGLYLVQMEYNGKLVSKKISVQH